MSRKDTLVRRAMARAGEAITDTIGAVAAEPGDTQQYRNHISSKNNFRFFQLLPTL